MAVVGWIDTDTVQRRVQRVVSAYQSEIRSEDETTLEEKTLDAYYIIIAKMVERGYTKAQVDTWVQREEFQRDIAACHYLVAIGFQRGDEQDWVDKLCRTDELEDVTLIDSDGAKIEPSDDIDDVAFSLIPIADINDDLEIDLP